MGWKSLAWASCLLPVLAGCGSVHRLANEARLAHTQCGIEHALKKDARAAWKCVRADHPYRAFTDEFHDGFIDGYVDYLDRGGSAQPPATPPMKYVAAKKYYTPRGHCLVRDYLLGFKYGADVAVASGKREYLTVPVLLPDAPCPVAETLANPGAPVVPYVPVPPTPQPELKPKLKSDSTPLPSPRPVPDTGKFGEPKKPDGLTPPLTPPPSTTPTPPVPGAPGTGKPVPPLPKPEVPVIPPFNPTLPGGKFAPLQVPTDLDLLPIPNPPLPVPNSRIELPPPPEEPKRALPSVLEPLPVSPPPSMKVSLPWSLDAVLLPPSGTTPAVLGAIPVIPFQHTPPAPTRK